MSVAHHEGRAKRAPEVAAGHANVRGLPDQHPFPTPSLDAEKQRAGRRPVFRAPCGAPLVVNRFVCLQDGPESASRAMARDETLVVIQRQAGAPVLIVRTHGWTVPALTVGRGQAIPADLTRDAQVAGVELARRPTGGGWLLHLPGDLAVTTAIAGPLKAGDLRRGARHLAQAITLGFSAAGRAAMVLPPPEVALPGRSEVCFARNDRDEVIIEQTKVAGIALCRFGRAALVQAAIPLVGATDSLAAFAERWDPQRQLAVRVCAGIDRLDLAKAVIDGLAAIERSDVRPTAWSGLELRYAEALRGRRR